MKGQNGRHEDQMGVCLNELDRSLVCVLPNMLSSVAQGPIVKTVLPNVPSDSGSGALRKLYHRMLEAYELTIRQGELARLDQAC